jgi:hypothetical protein
MKYKHIILTRFNLQYDLLSDIHIQDNWLEERFRLFEQYCFPSIIAQTNQQFDWVILLSDQTPKNYILRITQHTNSYKNIHLELCSYYEDVNILYKTIGLKYIQDYDYLLSTRVDNDDMLAKDFVATLQKHLPVTPMSAVLTFTNGIQWFERQNIAFAVAYDRNHFLNFWEEKQSVRTSLGIDHTKVQSTNLIILREPFMWCEIVHENNISNSYVPKYRYSQNVSTDLYPIKLEIHRIRQCWFLICEHIKFRYRQILRFLKKLV